jgi:hypothetical protein
LPIRPVADEAFAPAAVAAVRSELPKASAAAMSPTSVYLAGIIAF